MAYSSSKIKSGLPGEDLVKVRNRLGELFGESPTLRRIGSVDDEDIVLRLEDVYGYV